MNILELIYGLADHIETIANLAIIVSVAKYLYGYKYETIELSCGYVKLRKIDISCQNLTNIVSAKYYNGGNIPSEVRAEIIKITTPKWL